MTRRLLPLLFVCLLAGCVRQRFSTFTAPLPLARDETLVIGFVGGREPYDSRHDAVRRLALQLRARQLSGIHVETVINQRRDLARELVLRAFDRDQNGKLDPSERKHARVIVYGMSYGGAAVVKFARELDHEEIPVLLTVQVDSVGRGDRLIPSNVHAAANLYQRSGRIIRGEPLIQAADPTRTCILGNFLYDYKDKRIAIGHRPWYKRAFRADHVRMNEDPEVWTRVEELITQAAAGDAVCRSTR